jgi:hypothetical protein
VARQLAALLPAAASAFPANGEISDAEEMGAEEEDDAALGKAAWAAGCGRDVLKAMQLVGEACAKEANRTTEVAPSRLGGPLP